MDKSACVILWSLLAGVPLFAQLDTGSIKVVDLTRSFEPYANNISHTSLTTE